MTQPAATLWWVVCGVSLAVHLGSLHGIRLGLASPAVPARRPPGDLIFLGPLVSGPLVPRGAMTAPARSQRPTVPPGFVTAPPPLGREPGLPSDEALLQPRTLPPQLFATEKQLPHLVTTVVAPAVAATPVWIRGPARRRDLLHCPPLAPYLTRAQLTRLRPREMPETLELTLRFTVSLEGQVTHAEVLRSSGDPRLDAVGVQYLHDWRFAPLDPKDVRHPAQTWGEATLRMGLEPP